MHCALYQSMGFLRKKGVEELRRTGEEEFHTIKYFFANPPVKNQRAKIFFPSLSHEGLWLILPVIIRKAKMRVY